MLKIVKSSHAAHTTHTFHKPNTDVFSIMTPPVDWSRYSMDAQGNWQGDWWLNRIRPKDVVVVYVGALNSANTLRIPHMSNPDSHQFFVMRAENMQRLDEELDEDDQPKYLLRGRHYTNASRDLNLEMQRKVPICTRRIGNKTVACIISGSDGDPEGTFSLTTAQIIMCRKFVEEHYDHPEEPEDEDADAGADAGAQAGADAEEGEEGEEEEGGEEEEDDWPWRIQKVLPGDLLVMFCNPARAQRDRCALKLPSGQHVYVVLVVSIQLIRNGMYEMRGRFYSNREKNAEEPMRRQANTQAMRITAHTILSVLDVEESEEEQLSADEIREVEELLERGVDE